MPGPSGSTQHTTVQIRQGKPADATLVSALSQRVFDQTVAPGCTTEGITEFHRYTDAHTWAARQGAGHITLLAEVEGRPVGLIEVREAHHISLLFVDQPWQRQGIGRQLLDRALAHARRQRPGLRQLAVNAAPSAVTAYECLGFQRSEPERTVDGIRFVPMTLTLPPPTGADLFWLLHSNLPREGPGCAEATTRAWDMIRSAGGLPKRPRILDVGCGPGAQTLDLLRATAAEATIIALDRYRSFLLDLQTRAGGMEGLAGRDRVLAELEGDMRAPPFRDHAFDVVWSEGAIYIMGFDEGLRSWRRLLRPGGCLAVTEATWLVNDRPPAVRRFWNAEYPAMRDIDGNLAAIEDAGYQLLGHFTLPDDAWWDGYYGPLEGRLRELRQAYPEDPVTKDPAIQSQLADAQREIDIFRAHSASYGYVFYVMRQS